MKEENIARKAEEEKRSASEAVLRGGDERRASISTALAAGKKAARDGDTSQLRK